jgi:hypothetical protein
VVRVNIPDPAEGWQVVVTTPAFRRGQAVAWRTFIRDPDSTPNLDTLARTDPEFRAGYLDEYENFIVPERALRARREAAGE